MSPWSLFISKCALKIEEKCILKIIETSKKHSRKNYKITECHPISASIAYVFKYKKKLNFLATSIRYTLALKSSTWIYSHLWQHIDWFDFLLFPPLKCEYKCNAFLCIDLSAQFICLHSMWCAERLKHNGRLQIQKGIYFLIIMLQMPRKFICYLFESNTNRMILWSSAIRHNAVRMRLSTIQ